MNRLKPRPVYAVLVIAMIGAACNPANVDVIQPTNAMVTQPPATQLQPPPLPTSPSRRLQAGELVLAADIDDIPAVFASEALFVDTAAADEEIQPEEPVIGVSLNGESHAYPIRLLSLHEIVNDEVGGVPIAVTWCPLCYTAIAFDRLLEGGVLTFGVSGYLYYNNLVMYDHQSNTLWSQALGQAIRGARRGQRLAIQPSVLTTWEDWKALHPDTMVLSILAVEDNPERALDPYVGYYTSGAAGITGRQVEDDRLEVKELVVGIALGDEVRAYPLRLLEAQGLVNDRLGTEPLVLIYDAGLNHVFVYRSIVEQTALTFSLSEDGGYMVDAQTAGRWDIQTGQAIDGHYQGRSLERILTPAIFWFAWVDLYPQTEIYE